MSYINVKNLETTNDRIGGSLMIHLDGYNIIEEISTDINSIVLRGIRNLDNCPVIIKLLNKEYPSTKELSNFIREYEIMVRLIGDGLIKAYTTEKYNNSAAIIMEDIGGESVDKVLNSIKLDIMEKISLAIKMTECLIQLHKQNIIHKDVNPSNFIWNYKTNQVKIIDFGISAELIREASQFINLNVLEGSLNYLSPEQTGRINRPVDYRTDLYSLGVSFYELFTERLPFEAKDEIEMIYSHIAKTPIPPKEINHEVPTVISDIVMKLMNKAAEERYQSALGLMKDLEYCLKLLEEKKEVCGLILGTEDILDRFEIPHKLYGREEEIKMLINGFEKAASGNCEFLFVSGYSGIGKSTLIHEVRKPITGKKGYFISGKYNQFERDVPYYGITQAFKQLIRQLLSEPQSVLDNWKSRILEALGDNGQVILDVIPELEQIIGPQPQVTEFNPLEAQNRFKMLFREFINVFARKEHPLVIFLDDLQWSDTSTLDLLKYILETGKAKYILFIGAYRDNEVNTGHPLHKLLIELKNTQQDPPPPFNQIFLKPLDFTAINQLIADTFHSHINDTKALTNIIFQKTKGNPFFIGRVLNSLYLQGTFTFLSDKGQWIYDLKKVEAVEISDNVVDLLVKNLESLPKSTMDILKLVACIGSQFDLITASQISKKSISELGKDLWVAIEEEIVLPLNNNYRFINTLEKETNPIDIEMSFCFAHDRLRQAVYSLIPEQDKCVVHLNIGNTYLKSFRETKQADAIFDLVNHLNIGRNLVGQRDKRIELAKLNIMAGNKAKKSTAFAVALNYFETAKSLLSNEEWKSMPDKFFNLLLEIATVAFLSGDLSKADSVCEHLSKIASTNLEKGSVTNIKILVLIFQGKLSETIDEIRKPLKLLNIYLPESPEELRQTIKDGVLRMQQRLASMTVEDLVNLPVMNNPERLMAVQMLQMAPIALQANPLLFNLSTLIMFELTLNYGTSPISCRCFSDFGHTIGKVVADYKTGYKLGQAAFALINKFKAESQKPSVYYIFPYISYWRVHYKESIDYYDLSYKTGLKIGDVMHATYAISHKIHLLMWVGKNLNECKVETENSILFLKQTKGAAPLALVEIIHYAIEEFQSVPNNAGQNYQQDHISRYNKVIKRIEKIRNSTYLARFYLYNVYISVILDDMSAAEKWNGLVEDIGFAEIYDFAMPDYYLFKAMILINKWEYCTPNERIKIKESLYNIKKRIKNWTENCPANFAHKYYLLSALIAIMEKESLDTIVDFFKKALDSIGNNDFIQYRALCNELYGKFWQTKGDEKIAKTYIREAHYLYEQWGAYRKVKLLEKQYSSYFVNDMTFKQVPRSTKGTIAKITHNSIDMTSIWKSAQAISSEIKIEKLLKKLIRIMIENAGAQRGCILLRNEIDGQLYIEASEDINSEKIQVVHSLPLTENEELCLEIVQFVTRTRETLVIHDACADDTWQNNSYIIKNQIKSVLCMPVFYQNRLKSVVYLENNLSDNVFTSERLEALKVLSSQASISIENARLYENMEEKIKERTIQLNDANEKLKELSLHDPLTGLHNRRYAFEFTFEKITRFIQNKVISLSNAEKRHLSLNGNVIGVFLIDIDHFKSVNDTYGHSVGDNVLVTISKVLKQMIRCEDTLVRWGGEEFLIILYNTKPEYLEKFARKILDKIGKTPIAVSENETIYKTCSVGYSEMPLDLTNPKLLNLEQMINISDYALYCAKENGRNCAAHFKLVQAVGTEDELKKHLVNLSKSTKLNEDFFKIEFI